MTAFGGASDNGTVFKIDTAGNFSTLYSFTGGADGGFLYGGLAIDSDGTLYGSTANGGADQRRHRLQTHAGWHADHALQFHGREGWREPRRRYASGRQELYSTANAGGDATCQCGVVYEINGKGKEKVLHTFTGSDGSGYSAGLTLKKGVFYSTVQYGAMLQNGAVYSLTKK